MKIKPRKLPEGAHHQAGSYDGAGRWYPRPWFRVPESFGVRSPSRAYPYSFLKHFYTKIYAKALMIHDPKRYMEIHRIDPTSPEGVELIKLIFLNKIA